MSNFSLEIPVSIDDLLKWREDIIESWKIASKAIEGISEATSQVRGGFSLLDPAQPVKDGFCEPYPIKFNFYGYPHEFERQEHALDYSLWVYLIENKTIIDHIYKRWPMPLALYQTLC